MRALAYFCVLFPLLFCCGAMFWFCREAIGALVPRTWKGWLLVIWCVLMGIMIQWGMNYLGHPMRL